MSQPQRVKERLHNIAYQTPQPGNGIQSINALQPPQATTTARPRGNEYVESSHRSVLARKGEQSTQTRPQHNDHWEHPNSMRPSTPVPSLTTLDEITPPSTRTISPTTPTFDRLIENYRIIPIEAGQNLKGNIQQPRLTPEQTRLDPASTYQPRRMVPLKPSAQPMLHDLKSRSQEERSFMDWDDDPSKLQRVKQSIGLRLPNRPKKPSMCTSKNPDNYINASPRTRPNKPQGEINSNIAKNPQRQLSAAAFSLPNKSTQSTQAQTKTLPALPHNHFRDRPLPPVPLERHHDVPSGGTNLAHNGHAMQEDKVVPRPSISTTNVRPAQYRNWSDYDSRRDSREEHMAAISPTSTAGSSAPKSKRIKDIVKGVVKRVSKRDLRWEFGDK